MKRLLAPTLVASALATLLAAPIFAQDGALTGTVTDTFGRQIVIASPEGRLLVTLPDGVAAPATGAQVRIEGSRDGTTVLARDVTTLASTAGTDSRLPDILRGLGLGDVQTRIDDSDDEVYLQARMAEGGWLRAEVKRDRVVEVQTDSAPLPDALVRAMLPESILSSPRLSEIARLTEIDLDDDGEISVEGFAADGARIEIEFGRDGTLRDFERERDDRSAMSGEATRERLTALGYRDIGFVDASGRYSEAIATNPYGERVEVRLDASGQVLRERATSN